LSCEIERTGIGAARKEPLETVIGEKLSAAPQVLERPKNLEAIFTFDLAQHGREWRTYRGRWHAFLEQVVRRKNAHDNALWEPARCINAQLGE
jgi:hypothetical protein